MRPDEHATTLDVARARLAQYTVAFAFGAAPDELLARTRRSKDVAFARQVAMYLCHVAFGMSLGRVALAFGRDRTTVAHGCQRIEDRRDDPDFDAHIDSLEQFLSAAPSVMLEAA